ncbi:MAG: SURF1 family cytochrome oxidase biogenesis protein, partial [Chloroflexota bacterium]
NVERIGRQAPYRVLPVYIQQTSQAGAGAPIPHPEELELTEGPHFGYALQWFAFAAILVLGYPFYLRKQEERSS